MERKVWFISDAGNWRGSAFDISEFSVGMLFNKVDLEGAGEKNFRVNRNDKYKLQWDTVIAAQEGVYNATNNILIKDLEIEQPIK